MVNHAGVFRNIVGTTESLKRRVVPCNTYLTSSVSSVKDRNHIFEIQRAIVYYLLLFSEERVLTCGLA